MPRCDPPTHTHTPPALAQGTFPVPCEPGRHPSSTVLDPQWHRIQRLPWLSCWRSELQLPVPGPPPPEQGELLLRPGGSSFRDPASLTTWSPVRLSLKGPKLLSQPGHPQTVAVGSRILPVSGTYNLQRCISPQFSKPLPSTFFSISENVSSLLPVPQAEMQGLSAGPAPTPTTGHPAGAWDCTPHPEPQPPALSGHCTGRRGPPHQSRSPSPGHHPSPASRTHPDSGLRPG